MTMERGFSGFNMICSEEARDGWFLHESKYNVPPDHSYDPANFDYLQRLVKACKKEGIQLWANIIINGQAGAYWKKHPDLEPDAFYFNFLGYRGKFYRNNDVGADVVVKAEDVLALQSDGTNWRLVSSVAARNLQIPS